MAGPCPNGRATELAHKDAKCQQRERCQGPGCRLRRTKREDRDLEALKAMQAERAAAEAEATFTPGDLSVSAAEAA